MIAVPPQRRAGSRAGKSHRGTRRERLIEERAACAAQRMVVQKVVRGHLPHAQQPALPRQPILEIQLRDLPAPVVEPIHRPPEQPGIASQCRRCLVGPALPQSHPRRHQRTIRTPRPRQMPAQGQRRFPGRRRIVARAARHPHRQRGMCQGQRQPQPIRRLAPHVPAPRRWQQVRQRRIPPLGFRNGRRDAVRRAGRLLAAQPRGAHRRDNAERRQEAFRDAVSRLRFHRILRS